MEPPASRSERDSRKSKNAVFWVKIFNQLKTGSQHQPVGRNCLFVLCRRFGIFSGGIILQQLSVKNKKRGRQAPSTF